MKKIILIFTLIINMAFGKDILRRVTKFEYDQNNNLIKTQEFNKNKEKIVEINYFYNEKNQIKKYSGTGTPINFEYNEKNRIKSVKNYFGTYKFYYKNREIEFYDLINSYSEAGRYYIFSREDKEKTILKISERGFLKSIINKDGDIKLIKPTYETFGYSNQSTEIKKNEKGEVIEKIWGDKKDTEYHVKYFKYDSKGNLIEVKAVNKVKVISSFVNGIMYIFSIMTNGYSI